MNGATKRDPVGLQLDLMAELRPLDLDGVRAAVVRVLQERGPMTADEVAGALGQSVLAIRPRVTELQQDRFGAVVVRTGERRLNASGRPAAVVRTAA